MWWWEVGVVEGGGCRGFVTGLVVAGSVVSTTRLRGRVHGIINCSGSSLRGRCFQVGRLVRGRCRGCNVVGRNSGVRTFEENCCTLGELSIALSSVHGGVGSLKCRGRDKVKVHVRRS